MMSLSAIRQMQRSGARRAAREKREPFALFSAETAADDLRRAPWLGDYCPRSKGWRWAKRSDYLGMPHASKVYDEGQDRVLLFADKFGVGRADEPALSWSELAEIAQYLERKGRERGVTVGLGIYEEGQFQMHLAVYEKGEPQRSAGWHRARGHC